MRVHRLALTSYRGVEQVELALAERGVTVVVGPNEIGKSSLVEALRILLDYQAESRRAEVVATRPVHADVPSRIEAELECGPYRFIYAKQLHRSPSTKLEIRAPKVESLTGRDAHDRVRAILAEHLDLTLWSALCIDQGRALEPFRLEQQAWLSQALDQSAGGAAAAGAPDGLLERVREEHERYFTPRGKENKATQERTTTLEALRRSLQEAQAELTALEEGIERARTLAASELAAERADAEAERELRSAREAEAEVQRLQQALQSGAAEAKAAKESARRLAVEWERRQSARRELAAVRAEQAELERERARLQTALAPVRAACGAAESDCAAALAAERGATLERRILEARSTLGALEQRVAELRASEAELAQAEERRRAIRIDAEGLALLRAHAAELDRLEAQARIAGARLRLRTRRPVQARAGEEELALEAGGELERQVGEPLLLRIEDWLEIEIEPGAGARELAQGRDAAAAELQRELARHRVADLAQAAAAVEEAERSRRRAAEARERSRLLAQGETPAALEQRLADLREQLANELARREPSLPALSSERPTASQLALAAQAAERASHALEDARGRLEDQRAVLRELERDERRVGDRIADRPQRLAALEATLARERGEHGDEVLERAAAEAQEHALRLEAERAVLAHELERRDPRAVEARARRAREGRAQSSAALAELARERRDLVVRLEERGELGLRERIGDIERRLSLEEEEHASFRARAAAASLLYKLLEEERAEERNPYRALLAARIEELGRRVFDPSFTIELAEDLSIVSCARNGRSIPFASLSTGMREQLGVLSRLACALLVAKDGGVPLWMDDVLGYSDPERLRAMGEVLTLAGEQCQIVLLTSVPERYDAVAGASVRHLGGPQPAGRV